MPKAESKIYVLCPYEFGKRKKEAFPAKEQKRNWSTRKSLWSEFYGFLNNIAHYC